MRLHRIAVALNSATASAAAAFAGYGGFYLVRIILKRVRRNRSPRHSWQQFFPRPAVPS